MHFINKLYRYIRHFNVHISIIFRSYFSHSGSSTAAMNWLIFLLLRFCQYFPIPYFILIIFFLLVFLGSGFGCFSFSHSFLIVFRLFCFGSYESARWFALLYELLLVLPVHRANLLHVPLHFFSIDLFLLSLIHSTSPTCGPYECERDSFSLSRVYHLVFFVAVGIF